MAQTNTTETQINYKALYDDDTNSYVSAVSQLPEEDKDKVLQEQLDQEKQELLTEFEENFNSPGSQERLYKIGAKTAIIRVLTGMMQSGKGNAANGPLVQMSIKNGRVAIVINPSSTTLATQLSKRIELGKDGIKYHDSFDHMSHEEKEFLKKEGKEAVNVARFDTGASIREKDIEILTDKIEQKKVDCMVVLNNKTGLSKLMKFMMYCVLTEFRQLDFIADECHDIFKVNIRSMDVFNDAYDQVIDVINDYKSKKPNKNKKAQKIMALAEAQKAVRLFELFEEDTRKSPLDSSWCYYMGFILKFYSEYKNKDDDWSHNWNMYGVTATKAPLQKNKFLNGCSAIKFDQVKITAPECYVGMLDIEEELYEGDTVQCGISACIKKHVDEDDCEFTLMSHVGCSNTVHQEMSKYFVKEVKKMAKYTVCPIAISVNQKGYTCTLWNSKKEDFYTFNPTKAFAEPHEAITHFKNKIKAHNKIPCVGIFGESCMKQGTTFNNCSETCNDYISDYILRPLKKQLSLEDVSAWLQKIGRMFGNDREKHTRTIWTCKYEDKEREPDLAIIKKGYKIEQFLQTKDEISKHVWNKGKRLVKKGKLDDEGNVIESSHISGETPQQKLERMMRTVWPTANTCIGRFMRSLGPSAEKRDKSAFQELLTGSGFKKVNIIEFQNDSTKDHSYYGNIIQETNGKYHLRPELDDLYNECFP